MARHSTGLIDIVAGIEPRTISKHIKSSFPDPACAGAAKKNTSVVA